MAIDIVLLDLDHTLLAANTNALWHKRGPRRWREVAEGLPALVSLATRDLPAFQGVSLATLLWSYRVRRMIYGRAYPALSLRLAERSVGLIRRGARPTLAALRAAGLRLVLVSASDEPLAVAFAKLLGLDEVVSVAGWGLGFRRPVPYGAGKVDAVRRYLGTDDLSGCAFLSDHFSDQALLAAVGLPVAVNPGPRLAFHAERRGWLRVDLAEAGVPKALLQALHPAPQPASP